MKITRISSVVVNARMRNWIFVKVETDQPGLHGWGEATLEWKTKAVVGALEDFSQLLIGQDPRRVEHLWQIMHRQFFWRGGIVNCSAMSGIDQALWDIKRGHSYYLQETINRLPSTAKIVLLGSCGGYQKLNDILNICPTAQIISSKQVQQVL